MSLNYILTFFSCTELMQLIAWLLHPEPAWRCTMQELEKHHWLGQPVNPDDYKWEDVLPGYCEFFIAKLECISFLLPTVKTKHACMM